MSSFRVYIDESGDEGFSIKSTAWFVLAAVMTRTATDMASVSVLDKVRTTLGMKPHAHVHFRDLTHDKRTAYVRTISPGPIRACAVLIHKRSMTQPEVFTANKKMLYPYACRYLLERVSWFCAGHRRQHEGDGSADTVFAHRRTTSYSGFKDYLDLLKGRETSINWGVIKSDQVTARPAPSMMGLQLADAVASSFFKAVEPNAYGHVETGYVSALRPIMYQHTNKKRLSYGVKLWPETAPSHASDLLAVTWDG